MSTTLAMAVRPICLSDRPPFRVPVLAKVLESGRACIRHVIRSPDGLSTVRRTDDGDMPVQRRKARLKAASDE